MPSRRIMLHAIAALAVGTFAMRPAAAEDIVVSNYGISANGMPFAVALAKRYFQEEGADVTGIVSSQGGGTSLRNMMGGGIAYAEANPGVTGVRIKQGAALKIIPDNLLTLAKIPWVGAPHPPSRSLAYFKGKQIKDRNTRARA